MTHHLLAKTKTKTKVVQTERERERVNNQHGGMDKERAQHFSPLLFIFVRPVSDNVTWHTLLILAEWRACPAICLGHCCSLRSALFLCPPPLLSLSSPPPPPPTDTRPALPACSQTMQPTCYEEAGTGGKKRGKGGWRGLENNVR